MRFVVEPGVFGFGVGSSAQHIRQQSLAELTGAVTEYEQRGVIATRAVVERLPSASSGATPAEERSQR
jgi:hypothetical protein